MAEKIQYSDCDSYSKDNPVHIGFFAFNGVGKTTFAVKGPVEKGLKVVHLDCTDAGAVTLRGLKGDLQIVRVRAITHFLDVVDDVKRRFDSGERILLVVDTFTGLQSIALREVKGKRNFEMNQRKWGLVSSRIIECVTEVRNYPGDVTYLIQEKRSGNDDEPTTYMPALTPSSSGFLSQNIDWIGRIYLEENDGKMDRLIDFRITEHLEVKDRANTFPKLLKNATYLGIHRKILQQLTGEDNGTSSKG